MKLAHCAVETIISESIRIELPWLLSLQCEMGKRDGSLGGILEEENPQI